MSEPRERLTRLVKLAGETAPETQRALAFELCDLLLDWPERYPRIMREPFEALVEKVLRRLDEPTRRLIAERLSRNTETPVAILNELYFDVPPVGRARILARNAQGEGEASERGAPDEIALLKSARASSRRDFVATFARSLGLSQTAARAILADVSGDALAVACKGAGMKRAVYSALVVCMAGALKTNIDALYERLSAFDVIPEGGARRMLAYWRGEGRSFAA
jgi:hypothetical protein